MKIKRWVLLALVSLIATVFVTPTLAKKSITIWLGYPETASTYEMTKKIFEKKYPDFQVEILSFTIREQETKLAAGLMVEAGPDVLPINEAIQFPMYQKGGYLEPVPDDIAKVVNDPKIVNPVFAKAVTRNGVIYGLPYFKGNRGLFYNKDHLKEAGLADPPKTVEEFWNYAEKLVKKDAAGTLTRAGATLRLTGPSGGIQKWSDFYYLMGGEQVFEPGKELGTVRCTLKKNLEIAAKTLMDHVNHLHGNRKVDDWKLKHDAEAFAGGVASMLLRESWVIAFTKKRGPDINFGATYLPRDKHWGVFNFTQLISVNASSKVKSEAWDFVRMLQEQEILMVLLKDSGWLPVREDRDYSSFLAMEPAYKAFLETPKGYVQFVEAPNIAYEEVTRRTGEVVQEAFRDASLVDNLEGCKKVISRAYDVAVTILKDSGIYAE